MTDSTSISIGDKRAGLEVVAIVISGVTLLATLGGWIWFGGRLAQRVDNVETVAHSAELEISTLRDQNGRQDSDIAVTKSQYLEIIKRLDKIDNKLDQPVRIR